MTPSTSKRLPLLSTLFPKSLSRTLTSLTLSPSRIFLLIFLFSLLLLSFRSSPSSPSLAPLAARSYAPTVTKDCPPPPTRGRTFETAVRSAGVSFVSWTADETFSKDLVHLRSHEAVRILSHFQRSVTLLDVGANIGKVTFPVLAMPYTHSVLAVEPVSTNVNLLCMTANLNGWLANPGFTLLQAAFSDHNGKMDIFIPQGREDNAALNEQAATANVHEPQHGEVVRVLVGDDVLEESGIEPEFIKIDTQGHELHVLKGLQRYLKRAPRGKVLVMAESDPKLMKLSHVNPMDIYDLMVVQLGYSAYCRPTVEVIDGEKFQVSGKALNRETYPPGGCRDIFYFKQPL